MSTFLLSYFLIGFVVSWCATHIMRLVPNTKWQSELLAAVFWPLASLWALVQVINERRAAKP